MSDRIDSALPSNGQTNLAPEGRPTGIARVSRLVARRTTDLLAIAILATGGLMVGGRLSEWWSTEEQPVGASLAAAAAQAGSSGDWGLHGSPVVLEFGDFPQALRRQTVRATEPEAAERLAAWCRDALVRSDAPATPPTEQEARLLKQLESLRPVEAFVGGRVYRVDVPLLMALGVRKTGGKSASQTAAEAATGSDRVVCWGFAFPQQKDVWTFFLSSDRSVERGRAPVPEVPLPKGSRRLLSLRGGGGDGLVGFSGKGEIREWQAAFDGWCGERGWTIARPWSETAGGLAARFASPEANAPQAGWRGTMDVLLRRSPDGDLSGILNFLPAPR